MPSTLETIAHSAIKTATAATAATRTITATVTATPSGAVVSTEEIDKILERNHHLNHVYSQLAIAISVFAVVFALGIAGAIALCYFKIKTKAARMGVNRGRKWFGAAKAARKGGLEAGVREMI